ncbi:MAG: hypothetical protein IPF54_21540 [Draconibacterium sp.]|nr:hypothetical protein [Draconibacterium sp.]
MSSHVAKKAIDFVFKRSKLFHETINIGWFGGEPLLEFERMKEFTMMVKEHPSYSPNQVFISLVSNGTIFNEEIGFFLKNSNIIFGVSCDGPPKVQNQFRKFKMAEHHPN